MNMLSEIKIPVTSSERLKSQVFKEFEDDGNGKGISDLFGTRIQTFLFSLFIYYLNYFIGGGRYLVQFKIDQLYCVLSKGEGLDKMQCKEKKVEDILKL